jgi:hypothetical protein
MSFPVVTDRYSRQALTLRQSKSNLIDFINENPSSPWAGRAREFNLRRFCSLSRYIPDLTAAPAEFSQILNCIQSALESVTAFTIPHQPTSVDPTPPAASPHPVNCLICDTLVDTDLDAHLENCARKYRLPTVLRRLEWEIRAHRKSIKYELRFNWAGAPRDSQTVADEPTVVLDLILYHTHFLLGADDATPHHLHVAVDVLEKWPTHDHRSLLIQKYVKTAQRLINAKNRLLSLFAESEAACPQKPHALTFELVSFSEPVVRDPLVRVLFGCEHADLKDFAAVAKLKWAKHRLFSLSRIPCVRDYCMSAKSKDHFLLLTEFHPGRLSDVIRRVAEIGEPLALHFCAQLLAACREIHGCWVFHLDIHPGNVLLAEDGTIRLDAFGDAGYVPDPLGRTLRLPSWNPEISRYSAPEQVLGTTPNVAMCRAIDLWHVGVIGLSNLDTKRSRGGRFLRRTL